MTRIPVFFILFVVGCSHYPLSRDSTNAVLWIQTAAEYEIAVRQSFRLARVHLDEALGDGSGSPAIIMDLDETVLDNSAFEASLIAEDRSFDMEAWQNWLSGTDAQEMPGALEFITYARQHGIEVFFVTNRHERYRRATLDTLGHLGILDEGDSGSRLLMREQRPTWTHDKTTRRDYVAEGHRVVLVVGNDLNDFVNCRDLSPEARNALAREHSHRFGGDWILIPSPSWGSWLEALHGHRNDLSDEEIRAVHLEWLESN